MAAKVVRLEPGETLTVEFTDSYVRLRERLAWRIEREAELRNDHARRNERQGVAVQNAKIQVLEDVISELDKIKTQP